MANKMIGFLGADKYDILLYLSKILCELNQKVLLVDYAENRALTYCIPTLDLDAKIVKVKERFMILAEQQSSEPRIGIITYQGIDFLMEPMYSDLLSLREDYDTILIDFGFQIYSQLLSSCEQIYLYVDQQFHHISPLRPICTLDGIKKENCYLILHEIYACKVSVEYIKEELELDIEEEKTYCYDQEPMDMKYCIDSQYNHTYHFMKLSRGLKGCIQFLVRNIVSDISEHEMKMAYRIASRMNANFPSRKGKEVK